MLELRPKNGSLRVELGEDKERLREYCAKIGATTLGEGARHIMRTALDAAGIPRPGNSAPESKPLRS